MRSSIDQMVNCDDSMIVPHGWEKWKTESEDEYIKGKVVAWYLSIKEDLKMMTWHNDKPPFLFI
jgi:hypothetical protein